MINASNGLDKNYINSNSDCSNFDAYDLPCYHAGNSLSTEPALIEKGIYGAAFKYKNEETLYLRMELLTEETAKSWVCYKEMANYVANVRGRGVLSGLVKVAGTENYPAYEKVKEVTGFTEKEFAIFTEKAIQLKKRNPKIATVLASNSTGCQHMGTGANGSQYIVYVTRNPHSSIKTTNTYTLKNFIDSYSDILISVGSNFSQQKSFHNRGISRNPHWVFEEKYAGLSMLLHGFTGAVAAKFFPEKEIMFVRPVGSMQYIIKQNLLLGEGYIEDESNENKKIDITNLETQLNDDEGWGNYIKLSALKRIYDQAMNS